MKFTQLLLYVVLLSGYSLAEMDSHHNMDMGDDTNNDNENEIAATTENSTESLEPIPHVMKHMHGVPILETHLLPEERLYWENYNTTTYFTVESSHRPALYLHIVSGLIAIVVMYPICLILNNLNMGKSYMISLLVHTGTIMFSLLNYSIFINSIPDLYPGNAYNKMIIILFVSTILQLIFAFIKNIDPGKPNRSEYFQLATAVNSSDDDDREEEQNDFTVEKTPTNFQSKIRKFRTWVSQTIFYKISKIGFNLLNWGHFFYYLILVPTGVATFCVYGKGSTVFNLLAHFIKGGVFFSYGIMILARYSGSFVNKGWAWNHKYISRTEKQGFWFSLQNKGLWTMELIESSLILFYGSTNIFLEHLSNAGGEWSPKDLQHVSIAFIFIGCGLCGVITELKLQDWRYEAAIAALEKSGSTSTEEVSNIIKASPGFSPNPFPIITIFWTGYLMSNHQQASELSTEIHTQWGNIFVGGCAFRLLTYMMLLLSSKTSKDLSRPSRPITELVVSFCLLCGGVMFMESTDPVVLSYEYYGFTSMFILNITLGFTTLLMAWQMLLFAFKDWLKQKYARESIV